MTIEYFNWCDVPQYAEQVLDISGSYYLCHKHYPGFHFVIEEKQYQEAITNNTLSELPPPPRPRLVSPYIFDKGDLGWYIMKPSITQWIDIKTIVLVKQPEDKPVIRVTRPGEEIVTHMLILDQNGEPPTKGVTHVKNR